jgi:cytochrome c2
LPALQAAGLVWSEDSLNQWLTDPKKFVPGARMPVRVLDSPSRRDLVAYLQQASPKHGSPNEAKAAAPNGEY